MQWRLLDIFFGYEKMSGVPVQLRINPRGMSVNLKYVFLKSPGRLPKRSTWRIDGRFWDAHISPLALSFPLISSFRTEILWVFGYTAVAKVYKIWVHLHNVIVLEFLHKFKGSYGGGESKHYLRVYHISMQRICSF